MWWVYGLVGSWQLRCGVESEGSRELAEYGPGENSYKKRVPLRKRLKVQLFLQTVNEHFESDDKYVFINDNLTIYLYVNDVC